MRNMSSILFIVGTDFSYKKRKYPNSLCCHKINIGVIAILINATILGLEDLL